MIAGLVVAGFGLASVYIAPTAQALLGLYGVSKTMIIFGLAFFVIVVALAQVLRNPPEGYVPFDAKADQRPKTTAAARPPVEMEWRQMIRTSNFWLLWTMYAFGAAAGLMVIGSAANMSKAALGPAAFVAVAVLAVGNAGGRVLAGVVSDIIGRQLTLFFAFLIQSAMVLIPLYHGDDSIALLFAVLMIGACYGANLALFPSATKDHFGLKSFGHNYGVMFTAWGVGGLILPRIAGMVKDLTGKEDLAFHIASGLMICGAALALVNLALTRRPHNKKEKVKKDRTVHHGHHPLGT
jgi:hypothetical protein